jgi:hypothetical protein
LKRLSEKSDVLTFAARGLIGLAELTQDSNSLKGYKLKEIK